MQIREVEKTNTHLINLYEFLDTEGNTITSFFHVIKKPRISLGTYDTLDLARDAIEQSIQLNLSQQFIRINNDVVHAWKKSIFGIVT